MSEPLTEQEVAELASHVPSGHKLYNLIDRLIEDRRRLRERVEAEERYEVAILRRTVEELAGALIGLRRAYREAYISGSVEVSCGTREEFRKVFRTEPEVKAADAALANAAKVVKG